MIPGAVLADDNVLLNVVPETCVFDGVDSLLGGDVQVDALHDATECCTQVEGKMRGLHTPAGERGACSRRKGVRPKKGAWSQRKEAWPKVCAEMDHNSLEHHVNRQLLFDL